MDDLRLHMGNAELDVDIPKYANNEEHWKNGVHYDRHDKPHRIDEISDDYLMNIINHFSGSDISPLIREARKREWIEVTHTSHSSY